MKGLMITLSISLIMAIAIVFLAISLHNMENETQERIYNKGICTECNGHYNFISAAKDWGKTYYYYQCDNCGKIIELSK